MPKKLLVTGGAGMIGSAVCRTAALMYHTVVSVSRRGAPSGGDAWTDDVTWVAADVFDTAAWEHHLEGCAAVVHTVGILLENRKAGVTYTRINGEAAEAVGRAAVKAGVPGFVFLSADAGAPLLPKEYLRAKRRAESALVDMGLRTVVLRPSIVYSPQRAPTVLAARALRLASYVPFAGKLAHARRGLSVGQVALAAVYAAVDPNIEGVLTVDDIEEMAGAVD